jgi:hypothetical protein
MKPSKETIENFKKIYQDEFGQTISDSQAYEKFLRLVNLLKVVLKEPSPNGRKSDMISLRLFDEHLNNDKLKEP